MVDYPASVANKLIADIKSALGTEEDGSNLVEVARNAHKAEQELSDLVKMLKTSRDAKDIIKGLKRLDNQSALR